MGRFRHLPPYGGRRWRKKGKQDKEGWHANLLRSTSAWSAQPTALLILWHGASWTNPPSAPAKTQCDGQTQPHTAGLRADVGCGPQAAVPHPTGIDQSKNYFDEISNASIKKIVWLWNIEHPESLCLKTILLTTSGTCESFGVSVSSHKTVQTFKSLTWMSFYCAERPIIHIRFSIVSQWH